MKRFKKLGILLGVLAMACIATVVLNRYEQKQEQIKNSDEIILQISPDSVTGLSWEYAEGDSLSFHKDDAGWHYTEDEYFPVSEEKVLEILSGFENFGVRFIIENVEDYSQYGLEEPECIFHVETCDNSWEIRLGAFSTMDQQRYIDIGDGNVYLVEEDPMDSVSAALSDMILHDDTPGFETVVDIRFEGSENYMIQRLEDTSYSYSEEDVYFTQKNGEYLPLDTAAVTAYLNTITTLDLLTYASYNATEEELAACGLEEPELSVTVNYTYTDEDSEEDAQISDTCILHIGRNPEEAAAAEEALAQGEEPEAVSCYVRIGDSQIIYSLDSVDYGILADASYEDLRHGEVFWSSFEDVTQIDIALENAHHTLICQPGEGEGEEAEEERVWYYQTEDMLTQTTEETVETVEAAENADGTDASEETADALDLTGFQNALNALFASSYTDETPSGKEEIRLTLHLNQEAFPTVEIALYRYDGSDCLAVINGQSVSLVPRSSVMELVETVQAIVLNHL